MIHIIGASGFIGGSILKHAKHRKDIIFYTSNQLLLNNEKIKFFSIKDKKSWDNISLNKEDKVLFLSWRHLPNYNDKIHISENLIESLSFLNHIISKRFSKLIISGTCYEYGLQTGKLSEDIEGKSLNCYANAKNCLRKLINPICEIEGVELAWLRIFYPYGIEQNPNSLYPSLLKAIEKGDKFFPTSPADQVRDFISVEAVVNAILSIIDNNDAKGIINIGSGKPITIKDFLEAIIKERKSDIKLKLNVYKRRNDEPFSFWADTSKLNKFLNSNKNI